MFGHRWSKIRAEVTKLNLLPSKELLFSLSLNLFLAMLLIESKASITECGDPLRSETSIDLLRTTNGFWSLSRPIMPVDSKGHLAIPPEYTHVKLDVGLSFNAPNSALWLDKLKLPGRFVIGIEPNAKSFRRLESGYNNIAHNESLCTYKICDSTHPMYKLVREQNRPYYWALDASHIGKDWFGLQAAVDDGEPRFQHFNVAEPGLVGTDSLLDAKDGVGLKMVEKMYVPVIRLSDVFDRIDFSRFKFVEHLKVDAQGMDGRVLRSAKQYLKERVVYVTAETGNEQYVGGNEVSVADYLSSQGFQHEHGETWVNSRFKKDASLLNRLDSTATES